MGLFWKRSGLACLVAALGIWSSNAQAMQFSTVQMDAPGEVFITAVGEIIPGDLDRLRAHIGGLSPETQIMGFVLDSPGGSLNEALKIANVFHHFHASVMVPKQAKCVSACFLMFAAGARRVAEYTALIGVHSASENGVETAESMAITTEMARDAATFGVPPGIIGKMVVAEPGQMEWLTQRDLVSMGVRIIQPDPPISPPPPQTTPPVAAVSGDTSPVAPVASLPASPAPVTTPPTASPEPPAFQEGLADRNNWEQWFRSLSGPYLDGASFWAGHRSDPRAPSCNGTGSTAVAFTSGCLAAQQRLAAVDVRRKSDPDYRRGWNSF